MHRAVILVVVGMGLVGGAVVAWVAAQNGGDEDTVVKYDRESRYYRIRVVDYPREGRRCLHFSKSRGIQSSMILAAPDKLDLRYSRSMMGALALHPEPKDVLLVGLGGASIPKFIQRHWPDIRLDIVELDPDVVKVCLDWFQFKGTPNTRVIVMDGRMYLKRVAKQYDVILLDAYAADRIPFHMTTLEFVWLVKKHLKPGGIVATNLWEHAVNRFYLAELRTYQDTFPQTYLFRAGDSGNVIVFATLHDRIVTRDEWLARAEQLSRDKDLGFDLPRLVTAEYERLTPRQVSEAPLTDDMAPVDTLRHENPRFFDKE
jgi:spermidine synthase